MPPTLPLNDRDQDELPPLSDEGLCFGEDGVNALRLI